MDDCARANCGRSKSVTEFIRMLDVVPTDPAYTAMTSLAPRSEEAAPIRLGIDVPV